MPSTSPEAMRRTPGGSFRMEGSASTAWLTSPSAPPSSPTLMVTLRLRS